MSRSIVVLMALLAGVFTTTAHAFRVLEQVEYSVELMLRDLRLPTDAAGTVQYRACATCTVMTHTVTAETKYVLNDRALPLAEFLAAVDEIRDRPTVADRTITGVFLDINTKRVNKVVVVSRQN